MNESLSSNLWPRKDSSNLVNRGNYVIDYFKENETPKEEIKNMEQWKEFISDLFSPTNDSLDAQNIVNQTTWLKDDTRETIQILIDTGEFDFTNKLKTVKDFVINYYSNQDFSIDQGRRLEEMKLAIQKAQEGLWVHIMLPENGSFTSDNIRTVETKVNKNVKNLNRSIVKGLLGIYKKSWENTENTFHTDTWANIGLYIENRNGDTKLTEWLSEEDKELLKKLAQEKQRKQEIEISSILEPLIQQLTPKQQEEYKIYLGKNDIEMDKNGTISLTKRIQSLNSKENTKDLLKIAKELLWDAEELKKEANRLMNEVDEEAKEKWHHNKSVKQVLISLKEKLRDKLKPEQHEKIETIIQNKWLQENTPTINRLSEKEAQELIKTLNKFTKEIGNSPETKNEKKEIEDLLLMVKKQDIANKKIEEAQIKNAQAKALEMSDWNTEKAIQSIEEIKKNEKVYREVTQTQFIISRYEKDLKELGIESIQDANNELKRVLDIEKQRNLTDKELEIKNTCLSFIEKQKILSSQYGNIKAKFWEKAAQDIITDTGRFISNDPKKTYNFTSREAIGIINDPESTPQQRAFAKIGVGQSLPLSEFVSWNTAQVDIPELQSIKISKNKNGNFDIPGLKIENINQSQVIECIDTMELYGDIGLSQLIPHIPMITGELRKKWINTSIDGSNNTIEQQEILKEIYLLLFGRKIETSNIHEVIRGFKSNLGNPTNMKNAMQHVLKIHHLIWESGQSIAPDTLQKWIQWNQKSSENDMNPLAYI